MKSKQNQIKLYTSIIIVVAIFSIALLLKPEITGRVVEINTLDDAMNNLETIKEDYNQNIEEIPNFITTIFGDEVIDMTITRNDEEDVKLEIETENGKIVNLNNVEKEFTLEVIMSEETFNEILQSENQITTLRECLKDDSITYNSLKFTTSMKVATSRMFLSIRSWFD